MKTPKLSELPIYRELFLSEFDKNCFNEQKTNLNIQATVSLQNLCVSISRIVFIDKNQFHARIQWFI